MSILKKNKSGIFLIELLFVVLIILLSITSCVKIFFESQKLSEQSYVLTNAAIASENAAQLLKNADGSLEQFEEYYKANISGNIAEAYFNDEFENSADENNSSYKLRVERKSDDSGLIFFEIIFSDIKSDNLIYTLKVASLDKKEGYYE